MKKIEDFRKIYRYIGLISKNQKDGKNKTKSVEDLADEFIVFLESIKEILPLAENSYFKMRKEE